MPTTASALNIASDKHKIVSFLINLETRHLVAGGHGGVMHAMQRITSVILPRLQSHCLGDYKPGLETIDTRSSMNASTLHGKSYWLDYSCTWGCSFLHSLPKAQFN